MEKGTILVSVGAIILVLGVIFHFQGKSIIGPTSSFMYANPEWITHGIQIAVIGIITILLGVVIKILRRN